MTLRATIRARLNKSNTQRETSRHRKLSMHSEEYARAILE